MTDETVRQVQKIIGYEFKDENLLKSAFTHESYVNEHVGAISYERLEFLGDALLSFIVAEKLYLTTNMSAGRMSKSRAEYVSKDSLALAVEKSGLFLALNLGNGAKNDVAFSQKAKSDVFESLMGAMYLDSKDISIVASFVFNMLGEIDTSDRDYKSALQNYSQSLPAHEKPVYLDEFSEKDGKWSSRVFVEDKELGVGYGENKKTAQVSAAKSALIKLNLIK